jgi:uncharacterized protein (DUF1330 family)
MTAYIVFTREKTRDPVELEAYSNSVGGAMGGHKLTPRAVYGRHEVLEGAATEGVVILEFPTFDEAKAWYNSPGYTAARAHRFMGADYRVVIVEGM